jgi:predicted ATPase
MSLAERAAEQLLSGDAPWVALVGPPGVGKSHMARRILGAIPEGAFAKIRLIDASPLAGEAALLEALEAPGDAPDVLEDALLILDGVDAIPDAALSAIRPRVCAVLSTSRAAPSCASTVLAVEPLATPTGDALEGPAATLLLEAARRAVPGFAPRAEDAPFLAELLRELDGLPLAIELAAPRLSVLSPAALLHRVRKSRSVLRGPGARSFDAALEAAVRALEAWERDALAQLAVFERGATVERAEAVIDLSAHAGAPPLLDVLAALRARALLIATPSPHDGATRLGLLRSVRDWVLRHAEPAVLAEARRRHALHYGEAAEAIARAPGELREERAELVAVVERALAARPVHARAAGPALRVLIALHPDEDAPLPAGWSPLLEAGVHATRDSGADPTLVARALIVRGALRRRRGDHAAALRDLGRAGALARGASMPALEGRVLLELARLLHARGAHEARGHARDAIARFRELGQRALEIEATRLLARIVADAGDDAEADALLEGATPLAGDARGGVLLDRAELAIDRGDAAAFRRRLDEATEANGDLGRRGLLAALAALDRGDADDARRALDDMKAEPPPASLLRALVRLSEGARAEVPAIVRDARERGGDAALGRHGAAAIALSVLLTAELTPSAPRPPFEPPSDPIATALLAASDDATARAALPETLGELGARQAVARVIARGLFGPGAARASRPPPPDDAIVVAAEGRAVRLPGERAVDLDRRRPLARILARLAQERLASPGNALGWEVLLAAGWPGERVLATAGAHRVRVAVSTLRKLALRDRLQTTPEGYALDPSCPLVLEA